MRTLRAIGILVGTIALGAGVFAAALALTVWTYENARELTLLVLFVVALFVVLTPVLYVQRRLQRH